MIAVSTAPTLTDIARQLPSVWEAGLRATHLLRRSWSPERGTPVYTEEGRYTTRGWTEWTQGFQFGNALYLYEATGEDEMLAYGRSSTVDHMAHHLTHVGVHDHGFNNVSTYGNLLRMMAEGRIEENRWEAEFYRLALKVTGAVQAARWTDTLDGLGYVHTFNGPHSLFSDTIRSMRAMAVSHDLGHVLMGEQDLRISLLERLLAHAESTARYNVYFGAGRDRWDERGRTVHESIFNVTNGRYRNPSTQQGYTPFSTWTRGLAWVAAGYPEELEWLRTRPDEDFEAIESPLLLAELRRLAPEGLTLREAVEARWLQTACAVCDFHLENTPTDGVPYWDTGAPGLTNLPEWRDHPADPYNQYEPVDSSAAAITAQGLLRLAAYLEDEAPRLAALPLDLDGSGPRPHREAEIRERGERYRRAALVTARTLFAEPYLSSGEHEGILLHSIYHRPNGWDFVQPGQTVANGESCMWGDYHLLELAVMIDRAARGGRYQRFFDIRGTV
jgi:unsaturated chondroitin disaccharide hydrolase